MSTHVTRHFAEAYGRYAEHYASILEPTLQPIAGEIRRIARRDTGVRVLDLATGTGLLARAVARPNTTVIGIDVALGALLTARRRSTEQILLVGGDAHVLPFADGCLDLVTCGLSLSHFSDVSLVFREVRRILRAGGGLLVAAWSTEHTNPSYSAALGMFRSRLADEENPFVGALDEGTWGDPERGCDVLRKAGFDEVHVTTRLLSGRYRTAIDAVEWFFAWPPTRALLERRNPKDQEQVWNEAVSAVKKVNELSWQSSIHYYHARVSET